MSLPEREGWTAVMDVYYQKGDKRIHPVNTGLGSTAFVISKNDQWLNDNVFTSFAHAEAAFEGTEPNEPDFIAEAREWAEIEHKPVAWRRVVAIHNYYRDNQKTFSKLRSKRVKLSEFTQISDIINGIDKPLNSGENLGVITRILDILGMSLENTFETKGKK